MALLRARSRQWPMLHVVMVVGLLVASCSSAGTSPTTLVDSDLPDGPVAQFGLSRDEARTLHAAEQEYIRRCAAEAGFEFIPTAYEELERLRAAAGNTVLPPFGSDDVEMAAKEGYGLSERISDVADADPEAANRAIFEGLSAEEQRRYALLITGDTDDEIEVTLPNGAVVSTPRDGCISDVRRLLYGDLARYIELNSIAINMEGQIQAEAAGDPDFIAAEARWSACMHEKGWDVDSHTDAVVLAGSGYEGGDSATARETEIVIATDDAGCAVESGSVAAAQRALTAARTKVAGDLEGEILAYQEMLLSALDAARQILAG